MDVPHLAALSDLEYLLQQGCLFSNASQGQAQAQQLMHQPRFHDWLSSSRPDLLLVHGNFDACARITPLSYLCAHLSLGLSNTKGLTVLSFFCGQHESRVDSLRGPRGLLRSLITQLLYVGGSFNHDFINTRHYAESIKAHVVQDLCTTFKFLISQLPLNQRVFCFIENILWLESEEWMQDLRDVLEMLYRLAHDSSLRPILKILITSGTARCGLERGIHPQDQVHLIPGGLHGNIEISEQTVTGDLQSRIDSRVSGSTQSWQMVGDFSDESEEEGDYFLLD
ncbi:hypothetical protein BJY04DRAFT_220166 [Aspergillus karnatakaensis]|uniref:uncharacterized protein n=1 Tax=Aspergillus karnatakaensis TaxID=1810916 RepID=UPI003CCE37C5